MLFKHQQHENKSSDIDTSNNQLWLTVWMNAAQISSQPHSTMALSSGAQWEENRVAKHEIHLYLFLPHKYKSKWTANTSDTAYFPVIALLHKVIGVPKKVPAVKNCDLFFHLSLLISIAIKSHVHKRFSLCNLEHVNRLRTLLSFIQIMILFYCNSRDLLKPFLIS